MARARGGFWWILALACVVSCALAVAVAMAGFLPHALRDVFRFVTLPGYLLWFALRGVVFATVEPSSASDYALWIGGSAVFWFVVAAVFAAVVRWVRRVRMHDTR